MRAKAFSVTIQNEILHFATIPFVSSEGEDVLSTLQREEDITYYQNMIEEWKAQQPDVYGSHVVTDAQGIIWSRSEVTLEAGVAEIALQVLPRSELPKGSIAHAPVVDTILITNNPEFQP